MKKIIILLSSSLLLSLTGCTINPNPGGNQSISGAAVGVISQVEQFEIPEKINPGCRSTLPYPLKMTGESNAKNFSRWSANDIDGNLITQDILNNSKYTLIGVWMTYCSTHMSDLTVLQELYEAYPRSDLNILGIVASAQKSDGTVNEYEIDYVRYLLEQTGVQFKQLLPSDDLIAIHLNNINILPEYFILDSEGNIIKKASFGSYSANELYETINQILANN